MSALGAKPGSRGSMMTVSSFGRRTGDALFTEMCTRTLSSMRSVTPGALSVDFASSNSRSPSAPNGDVNAKVSKPYRGTRRETPARVTRRMYASSSAGLSCEGTRDG